MFLELNEKAAESLLSSELGALVGSADTAHYGTGNYEVQIDSILAMDDPEKAMSDILQVVSVIEKKNPSM